MESQTEEQVINALAELRRRVAELEARETEREQVEEALRESEERYRLLAEGAQDMIFVIDRADRIQYVNTVTARTFESRPEDLIGKLRAELFPPSIVEGQNRSLQQVFETGQPVVAESPAVFPLGEYWLSTQLLPMRNPAGDVTAVMGISRDITERKRAEESLQESEQRLRSFFAATMEGVAIHEKGIILDGNPAFAEMFGYDLSEIIGRNALELAAPESRDLVLHHILSGYERPYEAVGLRKDGSTFIAELCGKAVLYRGRKARVTALRDITARKRAEEALRESEARFRELADLLPQTVFEADVNGYLTYTNRHGLEATGYDPGDLERGLHVSQLFVPEERERMQRNFAQTLIG